MRNDEMLLQKAIQSVQAGEPDAGQMAASARRMADRLGIDNFSEMFDGPIESCKDVRHSLASYRAGNLPQARSLVIEAHLRDCSACRHQYRDGSNSSVLDWSVPRQARVSLGNPRAYGWALATAAALLVGGLFVYKAYWQIPPGVRAEVQSIDGSAYRITNAGDRPLSPGDRLAEGENIRTSGGAHAVLRLTDGSTVEVNERSTLEIGARGHNTTVTLDGGDVIVEAAKRTSGHLFVKTPDCRVAVTGTVFTVDSGIKGSRVGVLQGSVHVSHAGLDTVVAAGSEVTTNENLSPEPVQQQISWSHNRDQYLPLLAQLATLQHRIEQIPFPQPRYTSDLMQRVPTNTLLYISIPNLGDFLNQANQIFHDQMKQSPALQQWWNHGHDQNTADLDSLVDKIHQASEYLGDEIVIVGVKQAGNPAFAIVADVKRSGLDSYLKAQFPVAGSSPGMTVLDPSQLEAAAAAPSVKNSGFALIRPNEAIFSNSAATLKQLNDQLNAGASGFAEGPFGKQIGSAYGRGAGIILAADLQQMIASKAALMHGSIPGSMHGSMQGNDAAARVGLADVRYLIAEHREIEGKPETHLSLQFSGTRQGVASWLAPPAPIGSLEFVSPNASIAVAMLSKDPKAIADDILAMAAPDRNQQKEKMEQVEAMLGVNFRDDVAACLGGDFLLSLDGPVLPTPSWKAVIEVHDAQRLEQTLERLAIALNSQAHGTETRSIAIEPSDAGGQRYYAMRDSNSGNILAEYTFADGYMIVAPNRAILMDALEAHSSGNSLARSASFRALLPKDANENYSAIAYQNLTPVIAPLLSQFSGQAADTIRQLAADARPTAICARGEDDRIEAASDSRLFGFDFLTLETLMNLGNQHAKLSVKD